MRRSSACTIVAAGVLLTAACTAKAADPVQPVPSTSNDVRARAETRTALPASDVVVVGGQNAAELALATSRALFTAAPAVVLVAEDDQASLPDATSMAVDLQVPVLLTPAAGSTDPGGPLRAELGRLGARSVVPIGAGATRWSRGDARSASPTPVPVPAERARSGGLPDLKPAAPLAGLLVLALDQPRSRAAAGTARATGARVLLASHPDPRRDGKLIAALGGQPPGRVLALGSEFGPADRLRGRIGTAARGAMLPGGGQIAFPGRRMVALYGHPGDPRLGSLGEQPLDAAISRAQKVAASYRALVREPVVPAFEIITTVASSSPGPDGDYSSEAPVGQLRPWVDAARKAGLYVMLDLQPGRTDFLTQARRYTQLLMEPHVGLALDPEWRLKPDQRHMVQIGSVTAAEVNRTAAWLADLTRTHRLPQKVLMVHQFRLDMITNRATLDTRHDELAVVIHADGFGTPGQKFDTWRALHLNPPRNVWWGWKNFYDEDQPTFTPRQSVAVSPSPVFISYQ
jgi:hypothetical protein